MATLINSMNIQIDTDALKDQEVIGVEGGFVIVWNSEERKPYNCGDTIEEFGSEFMSPIERRRCGVSE